MNGFVDEKLRALIRVPVSASKDGERCFLDWFGGTYETQIVANESEFPLLGTQLLNGHRLEINYQSKIVGLE